jgi:hypothetical protein
VASDQCTTDCPKAKILSILSPSLFFGLSNTHCPHFLRFDLFSRSCPCPCQLDILHLLPWPRTPSVPFPTQWLSNCKANPVFTCPTTRQFASSQSQSSQPSQSRSNAALQHEGSPKRYPPNPSTWSRNSRIILVPRILNFTAFCRLFLPRFPIGLPITRPYRRLGCSARLFPAPTCRCHPKPHPKA